MTNIQASQPAATVKPSAHLGKLRRVRHVFLRADTSFFPPFLLVPLFEMHSIRVYFTLSVLCSKSGVINYSVLQIILTITKYSSSSLTLDSCRCARLRRRHPVKVARAERTYRTRESTKSFKAEVNLFLQDQLAVNNHHRAPFNHCKFLASNDKTRCWNTKRVLYHVIFLPAGLSEDSDYTSDVSVPVNHHQLHPNSSAHQYESHLHPHRSRQLLHNREGAVRSNPLMFPQHHIRRYRQVMKTKRTPTTPDISATTSTTQKTRTTSIRPTTTTSTRRAEAARITISRTTRRSTTATVHKRSSCTRTRWLRCGSTASRPSQSAPVRRDPIGGLTESTGTLLAVRRDMTHRSQVAVCRGINRFWSTMSQSTCMITTDIQRKITSESIRPTLKIILTITQLVQTATLRHFSRTTIGMNITKIIQGESIEK